jgi:predicted MFS family arabinose efflux permease
MSPDRSERQRSADHRHVYHTLRHLIQKRPARGAIGFSFCISAANDNLFVIYGAWLEEAFGLDIVALGAATTVIGVAELLGETLTAAIADRFGLLRLISFGVILSGISYLLLPAFSHTLPFALTALFAVFLTFEFSIVTSISLCTELLPDSRATMMSGYLAAASVGRVVGALIGGQVWMVGGILSVGCVSAFLTGLGLISLRWGLRGWQTIKTDTD